MNFQAVGQGAIWLLVVAGICIICAVGLNAIGVAVPPFVVNILWVIGIIFICIFAIKVLMGQAT